MIIKGELKDLEDVIVLAALLWPGHPLPELKAEFSPLLQRRDAAVFLKRQGRTPVGFAQCQLRHDYVEGTASSPVGYLEGIYVSDSHRRRGIAGELLNACEGWAREMGCREFASDCQLTNLDSLAFHQKLGFCEANRIICFTKPLM